MTTYKIEGNLTYNQCEETEDGFCDTEISEYIESESAPEALDLFLEENEQYDFFGRMTLCDSDTRGCKWAKFSDQNQGHYLMVEVVED